MSWLRHRAYTWLTPSWTTDARRLHSEQGFTLHEVLIAAAIFSLALLGLGSMQITAIKLNASAHINTQIATVAQEQMENLLTLPFNARDLQDNNPVVGQGTTYCVLYPPEGLRPCKDSTFVSSFPPPPGRQFCLMLQGAACTDANFPPPTLGSKVQWSVDINPPGAPGPVAQLAYINITASRKAEGRRQPKTFMLSFARSSL